PGRRLTVRLPRLPPPPARPRPLGAVPGPRPIRLGPRREARGVHRPPPRPGAPTRGVPELRPPTPRRPPRRRLARGPPRAPPSSRADTRSAPGKTRRREPPPQRRRLIRLRGAKPHSIALVHDMHAKRGESGMDRA